MLERHKGFGGITENSSIPVHVSKCPGNVYSVISGKGRFPPEISSNIRHDCGPAAGSNQPRGHGVYAHANCARALQRSCAHWALTKHHSRWPTQKTRGSSPPFRTGQDGAGERRKRKYLAALSPALQASNCCFCDRLPAAGLRHTDFTLRAQSARGTE